VSTFPKVKYKVEHDSLNNNSELQSLVTSYSILNVCFGVIFPLIDRILVEVVYVMKYRARNGYGLEGVC
jgi:hypothetical protein